jgi:hypothetical protein
MKFLGTVTIFICFALALTILNARALDMGGPVNSVGNSIANYGGPHYGKDTRAACALFYQRYGKRCGANGLPRRGDGNIIRRKVWR